MVRALLDDMAEAAIKYGNRDTDPEEVKECETRYLYLKKNFTALFLSCPLISRKQAIRVREYAKAEYYQFPDVEIDQDLFKRVEEEYSQEFVSNLYETCQDTLEGIEPKEYKECLMKIYECINQEEHKELIENYIKSIGETLEIEIDSVCWLKDYHTALSKIEREAPYKEGGAKSCFLALKDLIRCRTVVLDEETLFKILDWVMTQNVLQIKNCLNRKKIPVVYCVLNLDEGCILPPLEFQIMYGGNNHYIHDFYDLSRAQTGSEMFDVFDRWSNQLAMTSLRLDSIRDDFYGEEYDVSKSSNSRMKSFDSGVISSDILDTLDESEIESEMDTTNDSVQVVDRSLNNHLMDKLAFSLAGEEDKYQIMLSEHMLPKYLDLELIRTNRENNFQIFKEISTFTCELNKDAFHNMLTDKYEDYSNEIYPLDELWLDSYGRGTYYVIKIGNNYLPVYQPGTLMICSAALKDKKLAIFKDQEFRNGILLQNADAMFLAEFLYTLSKKYKENCETEDQSLEEYNQILYDSTLAETIMLFANKDAMEYGRMCELILELFKWSESTTKDNYIIYFFLNEYSKLKNIPVEEIEIGYTPPCHEFMFILNLRNYSLCFKNYEEYLTGNDQFYLEDIKFIKKEVKHSACIGDSPEYRSNVVELFKDISAKYDIREFAQTEDEVEKQDTFTMCLNRHIEQNSKLKFYYTYFKTNLRGLFDFTFEFDTVFSSKGKGYDYYIKKIKKYEVIHNYMKKYKGDDANYDLLKANIDFITERLTEDELDKVIDMIATDITVLRRYFISQIEKNHVVNLKGNLDFKYMRKLKSELILAELDILTISYILQSFNITDVSKDNEIFSDSIYNYLTSMFIWNLPFTELSQRISADEYLVPYDEADEDYKGLETGQDIKMKIKSLTSVIRDERRTRKDKHNEEEGEGEEKEELEKVEEEEKSEKSVTKTENSESNNESEMQEKRNLQEYLKSHSIPVYFLKRGYESLDDYFTRVLKYMKTYNKTDQLIENISEGISFEDKELDYLPLLVDKWTEYKEESENQQNKKNDGGCVLI